MFHRLTIFLFAAIWFLGQMQSPTRTKPLDSKLIAEMEKFINCPKEGRSLSGKPLSAKQRNLNIQKNRYLEPLTIDRTVTLEKLLTPGNDERRFDARKDIGAEVTGYLAGILPNILGEDCNCNYKDEPHQDIHLNLVRDLKDTEDLTKQLIVEVTPRTKFLARKRGEDWTPAGIMKRYLRKKITVTGWLMYDYQHASQSRNTNPNDPDKNNWRATAWEVHPVVKIKLANAR